jgi:uncharacterized RmlC-like cupin family protein
VADREIEVVRRGERREPAGAPTPGMAREEAFSSEGRWAGIVRTERGIASGWHHHGEHDTYFYVLSGAVRLEYGPGGGSTVDVGAGDFARIPAAVIHRESNPAEEEQEVVVMRVGPGGPAVVPVDGPDG